MSKQEILKLVEEEVMKQDSLFSTVIDWVTIIGSILGIVLALVKISDLLLERKRKNID